MFYCAQIWCQNHGLHNRTLCLLPYFMCANSEGSGETAQIRRLACAFAGRLYDKYHYLMSWLISTSDKYAKSRKKVCVSKRVYSSNAMVLSQTAGRLLVCVNNMGFHGCLLFLEEEHWLRAHCLSQLI